MNNVNTKENQRNNSTPDKQLIRYNSQGKIQWGIRFIYQADNAKLLYSRGRIFLIFAHYNIFDDDYIGHTADTVVTFNDELEDIDFGYIFSASHSLIQSATYDDDYFWTASLSDAAPEGIRVEWTSKKNFQNNYDAVFKKNNIRVYKYNDTLAGYIKGYHIGWADGKLGAILYFEKLQLYCLVYAKAKDNTQDNKNNINIIYVTTWKFIDEKITDITTKEIKSDETINIMQVRAGKLGDDKILITYLETTTVGHAYYGNIPKGSVPKIFVIKLPYFEYIKNEEKIDDLLMKTNEDLRTFRDGVLIWGSCDVDNNLVINKLGTVRITDIVPTVTWKDIYNFDITATKTIDDKEVNAPTLTMRGITSSQINPLHEFIIYLIFRLAGGARNMEENNEIKIETTCRVKNSGVEGSGSINMVDYECTGNNASSVDLTNYKIYDIEEGNNEDSLKKSNLNEVIAEKKGSSDGNLDKLTETSPSFDESSLSNIVIFTMDENIKNISANDFKFKFKIDGKLDQDITSRDLELEFDLAEVDTKANCIFNIGQNKISSLSCELNAESHKNIKSFSFKTSEITTDGKEIYLSKINDIALINSEEVKEEEDDDDDDKTEVIVVSVLCAVVAAVGIGIGIFFLIKKLRVSKVNNNENKISENNKKAQEPLASERSGQKVIEFKTMTNV